jgi:hypothetical protein
MTLDELRSLLAQIQSDPTAATDEQLSAALDAIRAQVAEQRNATPTAETVALLTELRDGRNAVLTEQSGRAEVAAQAAELLGGFDEQEQETEPSEREPEQPEQPAQPPAQSPPPGTPAGPLTPAQLPTQSEQTDEPQASDLQAVAASLQALAAALTPRVEAAAEESKPAGRPAGRIGQHVATTTPVRDAVTMRVHAAGSDGSRQHGQELRSTSELGRVFADRLRGGNGGGGNGRQYVARVDYEYPESRILHGPDAEVSANYDKIEQVVGPRALVAAGGLCAPLETLYDVEVIGSTARPVRDALARFKVERGGIQYRPNDSAAAAVYGAGVWTMEDDEADPVGSKGCYIVDCPGVVDAVVEAVYLCLEFSNISTRFDPEVTAANVQKGTIAHTRLAENRLLAAIAAGSKTLSAAKVIGATRDILVNLDKSTAYYRNRHRIMDTGPLTWIAPGWVKSLMRADLARQMAAGDWMEALTVADAQIARWFSSRSVTPVWHLDGPTGLNEVQTITITGSPTGGTFTLTYSGQTTAAIAYNATAAAVQSALEALSNINVNDITVAGGPGPATPWTVTFDSGLDGGQFDGTNVAEMTATSSLTGGTTPAVAVTTTTGGGGAVTVNGVSISSQTYANAAAGAAIPGFPDQIDSTLFSTGSWLFLDGGSLDLGLVRDSTLNDRNRYRQFMETFEGVADRGIESLRLVMTVQPTGQTSGTADLSAIAD